jgi:hypothetical protein
MSTGPLTLGKDRRSHSLKTLRRVRVLQSCTPKLSRRSPAQTTFWKTMPKDTHSHHSMTVLRRDFLHWASTLHSEARRPLLYHKVRLYLNFQTCAKFDLPSHHRLASHKILASLRLLSSYQASQLHFLQSPLHHHPWSSVHLDRGSLQRLLPLSYPDHPLPSKLQDRRVILPRFLAQCGNKNHQKAFSIDSRKSRPI